jgi:Flp pilus assembly protein TadG
VLSRETKGEPRRLWPHRRAGIAILFAILAIPLTAMFGLAIDYAQLNQSRSVLYLAANSAASNAVKVAATAYIANDANYVAEAKSAAASWQTAQLGLVAANVTNLQTQVNITGGASVTASVTITGTVASHFGRIYGIDTYNVSVSATAAMSTAPFLEVLLLLDNSASMGIGSTNADMLTLLKNSPCDASNGLTWNGSYYANGSAQTYGQYECSYGGGSYDGALACPVVSGATTYTAANTVHQATGPQCAAKINGLTAYAGPPCAFACHWDGSKAAGLGDDLWAMARRKGAVLRSDVVKSATSQVIASMMTVNLPINNLKVGVYTFNTSLSVVYPTSGGEAGNDWTAAKAAVGSAPTFGSGIYTDTGYQPPVAATGGTNNDTNFVEIMSSAAQYATAAGDGTSSSSPQKVLFLITDGVQDDSISGARQAIPASACQPFKDMGYKIYVAYTPYYPVMDAYYLQYLMGYNEGTSTTSVSYNLQACSSSTGSADLSTYYIEASDQAQLTTALQTFLQSALTSPSRFTQ